jgi:H+-transporting ATPase
MADSTTATATAGMQSDIEAPNRLNTTIESGEFNEKEHHDVPAPAKTKKPAEEEEEEDEDMDALIDELESQDGHAEEEEEEHENPALGRVVPEDQLQTDTRIGLTEAEVLLRRKKYGLNQMKEEKENLILKFLGYFIGPIQFVMEVCFDSHLPVA